MATKNAEAHAAANKTYEWGFSSDIEQEFAPKGLSEDTVRFISAKKNEPQWMLDWRLKAFALWQTMEAPDWAKLNVEPIDYQDAYYYAEPKAKPKLGSLDEVDPEILRVYEKLGIPIEEQKMLAGVEGGEDGAPSAASRSTRCSTASRSRPPSARSSKPRASSSARSARRSANIPSSSANGSARSCRSTTITSRR